MKKILFVFTLFLLSVVSVAQSKKVALHHMGTTSLFYGNSAFPQAIAAAASGDTIYIPGGFWDAGNIDKKLIVYGAGHYPDSTQATGITHLTGGFGFYPGSDSSLVQGLEVNGDINFNSGPIAYVTINRCTFNSSTMNSTTNHITYSENVVRGQLNPNNQADFLSIRNNFIVAYVQNIVQGALIENNIFNSAWGGQWYTPYNLHNVNGSLIRNNIFMEPTAGGIINGSNNLFQNNLFTMDPTFGTNTATANHVNVPPATIFLNYTGLNNFYYTDNYHLQNPNIYQGTDNTQVGIYGGIVPYKMASVPANPHIRTSTIAPTTDMNGNLNVNISVGAQNQ